MTGFVAPIPIPKVTAATNEVVTGWIDSHVPPEVTWTTNELSYYLSAYQKIKGAFKTVSQAGVDVLKVDYVALAVDIISVLGLTSSNSSVNVSKILQQVIADIESEYSGLSWEAQTLAWGTMEHDVSGPMSVATAYYNMNGNYGQAACPLPDTNGCGTASATGDIAELENDYSVLFGRPLNAGAVAGSWQSLLAATRNSPDGTVASAMSSPIINKDAMWVFDWRVGLTALAHFVSEYTQIYALTDPGYLNDNTWDTGRGGLQDLRTFLETLYTDMAKGVHADYMCTYARPVAAREGYTYQDVPVYCDGSHYPADLTSSPGYTTSVTTETAVSGSPVWPVMVGAADINTGIQSTVSGVTPTTLGPNCSTGLAIKSFYEDSGSRTTSTTTSHFIVPNSGCLADLQKNALSLVYSKMPLADLRATIDRLADMQGAPVELNNLPPNTIADCQAVADQYGVMQNSSWGMMNNPSLQAQWQASGCYTRASWLDTAWALRSSRALDYDGDGKADLAVWRPDNSGWRPLSGQVTGAPSLGKSVQPGDGLAMFYRINSSDWSAWNSISYGYNTDVPIPGYYEGPGHAISEAVWRPSNGAWYLRDSSGNVHTFNWGSQGHIPLPADYDGDGIDDLTVWDPASGTWYTFPSGGQGPYNYYNNSYWVQAWGQAGDTPVPADYDGDGIADRAVWRPTEGNWYILGTTGSNPTVQWGQVGDIPVPGNYEGLGTDLAIFRPTEGKFYILNHDRTAGWWVGWGQQGDIPVPGDYDGDGKADVAVFRPSNSTWYWINSTDWSGHSLQYGYTGDVPLP